MFRSVFMFLIGDIVLWELRGGNGVRVLLFGGVDKGVVLNDSVVIIL